MKSGITLTLICISLIISSCGKQKTAEVTAPDTTAAVDLCNQRIIHAHVFLKPEKVSEFIVAAKAMVDSSNNEAGCISYQLFQSPYDQTNFVFVEVWKDQAAIDAHFNMPYFTAWGPKTADWMARPTELKIFKGTQVIN